MKKILYTFSYLLPMFLFIVGTSLQAQELSWDFESSTIGDAFGHIGWSQADADAQVADDPVTTGNNVLKVTINNYNAAPYLMFEIPEGKTLADYTSFNFKGYFAQGDVGYKTIMVEAYETMPTAQFGNNTAVRIGSWARNQMGSEAWEDITIDITNTSTLSGPIYIAFGINCAGTGNVGGTGVVTNWYADDIEFVGGPSSPFVSDWGHIGGRRGGLSTDPPANVWKLATGTPEGSSGLAGATPPSSGGRWAALRGGFEPITATLEQAVVATGKIEFVGNGPMSWSGLRYGLFRHDSIGALVDAGTDSARWAGLENNAYGYMFTPQSASNYVGNIPSGFNGSQGVIRNGNWISTFGGFGFGGLIQQAPLRAEFTAGIYDWAISVQPLGDGTNEVRFYIVKEGSTPTEYWYGGTLIDTAGVTTTFNGLAFGLNPNMEAVTPQITAMNLSEVKVELGEPIVVPEAPFESFYVNQWGHIGGRRGGLSTDPTANVWKITYGEFTGDAGLAGETPPSAGGRWAAIRGGFEIPVTATEEKAIVVTGKVDFVGNGPMSWSGLRYGLFRHDSIGTLAYAGTDSASWPGLENNAYGYMFTPQSASTYVGNIPSGFNGSQGVIRNGNWISTFGGFGFGGLIQQAPLRAEFNAGTYDWAISVQPLGDGTNEVRFYIVKEGSTPTEYWYGGTLIDTSGVSATFNGIAFGLNPNMEGITPPITAMNLRDVKIDLGDPIIVPEAPFEPFYVNQWGSLGGRRGGPPSDPAANTWKITYGEFTGDAGIAGDTPPSTGGRWATIRGGFEIPVKATEEKAIIVTGRLEFVGNGPVSWSGLRYGLFRHDSVGTVVDAGTDSARWSGLENYASGYMFTPQSASNYVGNIPSGFNGTQGVIRNANWISTFGGFGFGGLIQQAPRRAEFGPGMYDWAISVQPLEDGTNEVRFYIVKQGDPVDYWYGGTLIDTAGISTTFNGIAFGLNPNMEAVTPAITAMNLKDVKVDLGDPIVVPIAPFEPFYVGDWGFIGGRINDWTLTPGEFIGNVDISGDALTDWAAIRGDFGTPVALRADTAVVITGKLELTGGGFEQESSLLLGVFHSDSAGVLDSTEANGYVWTGSGYSSGYLFAPPSGSNALFGFNGAPGTVGGIMNSEWMVPGSESYAIGDSVQDEGAVGSAGTYDFQFSIYPVGDGTTDVRYIITKGNEYVFKGQLIDENPDASQVFNSINFAVKNSTTTGLSLVDVLVDLGSPLQIPVGVEKVDNLIPSVYALEQNYPNPFNPTTMINYDIPSASHVKIKVYDILGRVVATLVDGVQEASRYSISWDASNLSSGVYFYQLETKSQDGAKDFVAVKKLMLMK